MILNAKKQKAVEAHMSYEEFKFIHRLLTCVRLGHQVTSIELSYDERPLFEELIKRFDYLQGIFNEKKIWL